VNQGIHVIVVTVRPLPDNSFARSMTASIKRTQVEEWMLRHADVLSFTPRTDAYLVKLGSTEVTVPAAIAENGVEAVRAHLQVAVPAAMLAKAEAMETAAAALRDAARDIRIPAEL